MTNSAASTLISAAASFLLVTLLILFLKDVLSYTLYYATNSHGRFFRLFFGVTLPSTVDRTCPGHDKGSAGTRQGDPTSSCALVQPSLGFPPAAGRRRKTFGDRSGDDGSDAEDNDRGKRPRLTVQEDSKPTVRCPFKAHDPENREFEKCGLFTEWTRLREHLLMRKHKPRDRCPTCGEIYDDDVEWNKHTSERKCQPSSRAFERPSWIDKDQAAKIRDLSTRGRKNERSIEEMYREVCLILFGSESAPDRVASGSGHPIWFPHFRQTDDLGIDHRLQEAWNSFKRRICNLLGMQNVLEDDTMHQLIDCVRAYREYPGEQTHVDQIHEPVPGGAAVEEHQGNNEVAIADWIPPGPPATPSGGQVPQIPQPEGVAAGGSEGHLEQSLSNSTYLGEGAEPSPTAVFDPAQGPSVGYNPDKLDYSSGCVNPRALLLQRPDAHHIYPPILNDISAAPSYLTSAGFTFSPAESQAPESTTLECSWDQSYKNTTSFNAGGMPDSSVNFGLTFDRYDPVVGSMQLSEAGPPEQQSKDRCF